MMLMIIFNVSKKKYDDSLQRYLEPKFKKLMLSVLRSNVQEIRFVERDISL